MDCLRLLSTELGAPVLGTCPDLSGGIESALGTGWNVPGGPRAAAPGREAAQSAGCSGSGPPATVG